MRGDSPAGSLAEGGIVLPELSPGLLHLTGRTVRDYMRGTAHRWAACLGASRIVGAGLGGATLGLAKSLAISTSQVENLARAGLGYRWLRKAAGSAGAERVQFLRRRLTPSHFCAVAEYMVNHDLPASDALDALDVCAQEGASVASLRDYLRGEYGGGVEHWRGHYKQAVKYLGHLANDYSVPPPVQEVARAAVDKLAELGY